MNVIKTALGLERALASPIDPDLHRVLTLRRNQLSDNIADYAHFIVVGPGDRLEDVEAAAGFPIATNIVDGVAYGHPDFEPSWEWTEWHGRYLELVFVLDDEAATVIFLPDDPGTDQTLLQLCREFTM